MTDWFEIRSQYIKHYSKSNSRAAPITIYRVGIRDLIFIENSHLILGLSD